MMNDEMLRFSLIDMMNSDLLNNFINKVFGYDFKDGEYVYIQYKIVNNNIILNIYDNRKDNRFKAYIFTYNDIVNDEDSIYYININECYTKYKNNNRNMIVLLGALLKEQENNEKKKIINYIDDEKIKDILLKHFTV